MCQHLHARGNGDIRDIGVDETHEAAAAEETAVPELPSLNLLVVDDSEIVRMVLVGLLRHAGHRVQFRPADWVGRSPAAVFLCPSEPPIISHILNNEPFRASNNPDLKPYSECNVCKLEDLTPGGAHRPVEP
jgi:hypothetical protein